MTMLNEGAVSWSSQLQKSVALSATEAEYVVAREGVMELLFGATVSGVGRTNWHTSITCR